MSGQPSRLEKIAPGERTVAEGSAGHTPGEPFGDVLAGREREVHGRIGFDQPGLPAEEWRERYYRADQRANAALDKYDSLRAKVEAARGLAAAVSDYAAGRFSEEMATGARFVPDEELSQLCAQADRLSALLEESGEGEVR